MGFSDVKAGLSFQLIDDLGKTFAWSSFVSDVSKLDSLEHVIRKQDEIVTIQNTKIVPYLEVDGCHITQVVLVSSKDGIIQLGGEEALEHDMGSLAELNGKNVVRVEVHVKIPGTISSLQHEEAGPTASSSRSTDAMQLLMSNQKKAHTIKSKYERNRLPQPKAKDSNGRSRLWNALLEFCVETKVQFLEHMSADERKNSFDSVVSLLWKLNLVEIAAQDWRKKPPKELDQFLGFSFHDTSTNGGKRKRPTLDQEMLRNIHHMLFDVLSRPCFTRESVKMHRFLYGLLGSIGGQMIDCLQRAEKKSADSVEDRQVCIHA